MSGHAKMPPAPHQVSATPLKRLIQQINPHMRVERDSGMCVARDLYEQRNFQEIFRFLAHARAWGAKKKLTATFSKHEQGRLWPVNHLWIK